ncbi:hypothetical protein SAMD00023353_0902720 [Rosellinia necatrix]|uniref:Ecp2 effector protein domain-containing protein n=1 Tax=Rosellinia necatrix TaxID=77044 RepID=A0A1W2TLD1_ROSNE|nr:hypothetical protein SAMD00023353_0902720 [Rosellinia necatrix]
MHAKIPGATTVCLAGILGIVSATLGDLAVGSAILPIYGAHGHHHASFTKRDAQRQGTNFPQPPNGPVFRCHDPHPEIFGPAPPVEDCDDVIKQFAALTTEIDVKLVEGCYQIMSGNCTGMVCPQRLGESTVSGTVAAQYMSSPLRDECIAKGQRGWWMDGQGLGIGVYLT